MRSRLISIAVLALTVAVWGCGGSGGNSSSATSPSATAPATTTTSSAPAGALTVTIMGQRNEQSFDPNPAPVSQGSLVVWRNSDNTAHRIVMNDGSFDSGDIAPGGTSATIKLSS